MLSEDFENWPGFDSHDAFDDSGLGLDEQEKRDQFSGGTKKNDEMEGDRWLNQHSSGSDEGDDPYSSAALSRRAEIILANAKKRLNVCATWGNCHYASMLTMTGHGRKFARRSRKPSRVANLQLFAKPLRTVPAYKYYARTRPTIVRGHWTHSPTHELLPILASLAHRKPQSRAWLERNLCAVTLLLVLIHDAKCDKQASVKRHWSH